MASKTAEDIEWALRALDSEDALERVAKFGRPVAPEPLEFIESYFGSLLTLVTDLGPDALHRRMTATYGNSSWGLSSMLSKAPRELRGEASWATDGTVVFTGEWQHLQGALVDETGQIQPVGRFEMCLNLDSSTATGSFEVGNVGDSSKQRWNWHPPSVGPSSAAVWRSRANGMWMDHYSMMSAWFFFGYTAVMLIGLIMRPASYALSMLCAIANVQMFCQYSSFLWLFIFMAHTPPIIYILAVYSYTLGYSAFTLLYATVLSQEPSVASAAVTAGLYNGGCFMFLVGSLLLFVYFPRFSVVWWGSAFFALGSACFQLDALQLCTTQMECGLPDASRTLNMIGLCLFVLGRGCFILGSETSRIDIFLRSKTLHGAELAPVAGFLGTGRRMFSGKKPDGDYGCDTQENAQLLEEGPAMLCSEDLAPLSPLQSRAQQYGV